MSCDKKYFVISNSDGDTHVRSMSEDELVKALNPNEHGDMELNFSKALTSLGMGDTNYWGDGFLIIKGEVVVPQPMEVVTQVVV